VLGAVAAGVTVLAGGTVIAQVAGPAAGPAGPLFPATPSPLQLQYDTDAPAAREALLELASAIQAPSPAAELRSGRFSFVQVAQWSLDMSAFTKDGTILEVGPQLISTWRAPDGSGKIVTTTFQRSDIDDQPDVQALVAASAHGKSQVSTYAAGELAAVVAEPVPHDVDALAKALDARQPRDNGPQSAVRAIGDLYRTSVVDREVRIAALGFLARTDGVLLRGEVTDRLGRHGLAVSADSNDGGTRDLLVFDQRTGWLLAYESMLLRHPGKLPVKAPAVFSYKLYLEQDRRPGMD
jgi:hypothetical protein